MRQPVTYLLNTVFLALGLSACGGGGGGANAPATAAEPTLGFTQVKLFRFSWTDVDGATFYRLLENPDGVSGFSQVGADIPAATELYDHEVPLYARVNARYMLQSCNDAGCTDSSEISVNGNLAEAVGYFKASNTEAYDEFGNAVALSDDGSTLAVGAFGEDSSTSDINSNTDDNDAANSGAVYVFARNGKGSWVQQAYIKASNTGSDDRFGTAVALSDDGNTLAVGAFGEDSDATAINGDQADGVDDAGAVYVFSRTKGSWSQTHYIKASNTGAGDYFGISVALSGDGSTLAVGAQYEDNGATGITAGVYRADTDTVPAEDSGAVYVFNRDGTGAWDQQAYLKASNTGAGDRFGFALALSEDGNTLAVGALGEGSGNADQNDDTAAGAGAVYVFSRTAGSWSQQAYVKASNTDAGDSFGVAVALSDDGNTLAVGAYRESSNANGIGGDPDNNDATDAGAVYVFRRDNTNTWTQQAYIKASNSDASDAFGYSVALSDDGNTLAVGAEKERSNSAGIGGDQADNSATNAGAVYVFTRSGTTWLQQAYVKASNSSVSGWLGHAVALSGNGDRLAVGGFREDGGATGIGGYQTNNDAVSSGAVYLY